MKHTLGITLLIITIFLAAQVVGLLAVANYVNIASKSGQEAKPLPAQIERPTTNALETIIMIVIGILIGTAVAFLIIRSKKTFIWNAWFGLTVFMLSYITLFAFFNTASNAFNNIAAAVIALLFAFVKSTKVRVNWIVRNIPELFIYAGFAILFSPLLPVVAAAALLLLISVYDAIAVWKSKHMVSLAKFQLSSGSFAGISINYNPFDIASKKEKHGSFEQKADLSSFDNKEKNETASAKAFKVSELKRKNGNSAKKGNSKNRNERGKNAILGGGDIAFPMLFAASALIRIGWLPAVLSVAGAAIALFCLLMFSKKDTFYPAMPFISAGTFAGFAIAFLIALV